MGGHACAQWATLPRFDCVVCGKSAYPQRLCVRADIAPAGPVPCMDGARDAREKNLTFSRNVRVQPCIRPLSAAVVAAGPDVIR